MLHKYLEQYKKLLISKDKKIDYILNDGLSTEEIKKTLCQSGYAPSQEIITLYKWGNGANFDEGITLNEIYLIPGYYLLPLTEAIRQALEFRKPHPFPVPSWEVGWLPILSDDMRASYLVDLSINNEISKVIEFSAEESEWNVFESIELFFRFQIECIEQGVYFDDEDGGWVLDYPKYTILKSKWVSSDKFTNSMSLLQN